MEDPEQLETTRPQEFTQQDLSDIMKMLDDPDMKVAQLEMYQKRVNELLKLLSTEIARLPSLFPDAPVVDMQVYIKRFRQLHNDLVSRLSQRASSQEENEESE